MVCESFQCLPDRAVRALENDPDHLIPKILLLRSFAAAVPDYERNGDKNIVKNPMIEIVRDFDFDRVMRIGRKEDDA